MEFDLESFKKEFSSGKKPYATMYFSDNTQTTVRPDKKTMKELSNYFSDLMHELEETANAAE